MRRLASSPEFASASTPAPMALLNNEFFQKCIRTFMKSAKALAAPAPDVKARDNIDRSLKPWNPDLYHSNL